MNFTQPKPRILLVDDIPATAASLATYFRQRAYDVRAVTTGLDAVISLEGWTPNVAFIDPDSAGGCGHEAAEALGVLDRPPLLVALLRPQSAGALARKKITCFDQVFTKAASFGALADIIDRHVAKKTIRCEV